jgi:hypothetical protein
VTNLVGFGGKELDAQGREDVLDVGRKFAREQLGRVERAVGHRLDDAVPLLVGERLEGDDRRIGTVGSPLDDRVDTAGR